MFLGIEILHNVLFLYEIKVQMGVMAIVGIEGSDASSFRWMVGGSEFSQGKSKGPIILFVGDIGIEILF
jgi:hypothetical protein